MKLTIRDVGQGDSLMLEWKNDKGDRKIGLIDCHNGKNNVDNIYGYILKNDYQSLDFFIMTHPHTDHYSGILALLKKLKSIKGFSIKRFVTSSFIGNDGMSVIKNFKLYHKKKTDYPKEPIEFQDLIELFLFLNDNCKDFNQRKNLKNSFIKNVSNLTDTNEHLMESNEYILKFISPTMAEINRFIRAEQYKLEPEANFEFEDINNPQSNNLSIVTLLRNITSDQDIAFFTSDSTRSTLERIFEHEKIDLIKLNKVNLVQVPHHGSKLNHFADLWEGLINKQSTETFISVGKSAYDHPHPNVIKYWREKVSRIYRTDMVDYSEMESYDLIDFFSVDNLEFKLQNNIILNYNKQEEKWIITM